MLIHESSSDLTVASDIGGTQMRAAVVTSAGEILIQRSISTDSERGIEDATLRLSALVRQVSEESAGRGVVGLGVSTAGPLDPSSGTYDHPPNLIGWHGKTMKPILECELKIPVAIGHDATLAALAETQFGPFKGARYLVYVTLSTGVGGGIIANGEMVTGSTGQAGEVGHITVRSDKDALSCNVGCHGCFEANASGPSIGRMARSVVEREPARSKVMLELAGGDVDKIDARVAFAAAEMGDSLACEVIDQVIENVARGLASLLSVFDPDGLVIGGGVVHSLSNRWDDLLSAIELYSLPRYKSRGIPVSITQLGDDVSILGASVLSFRRFGSG